MVCIMINRTESIEEDVEYVKDLMGRARAAQKEIEFYTQEQVDTLCKAIARALTKPENVKAVGEKVYEEGKMGDLQSKFIKLDKKVKGTYWEIRNVKTVGIIEEIPERGLVKIAKPVGVVAALIPCTQPEVTSVINAMFAIKGRNATVFSPHPRTQKSIYMICEIMRAAIKKHGAPEDLLICAENPTIPMSKEIMKQSDIIVATGGSGMVHSAYSSGTPAYGAGAGNANVIVDETADIKATAALLCASKFFDQSSGCSCENSVIVNDQVYDYFIQEMKLFGAYMATPEDKIKLQKVQWPNWPNDHTLGRNIITQSASVIAQIAGFSIPEGTKVIMVEENGTGKEYPFSGEKLSIVLTVYKYNKFDDAIRIVQENLAYQGLGHSCGIHSFNDDRIMKLAMTVKATRVAVRQAMTSSNSGDWSSGNPWTATLGCGTWGHNIVSENITVKHFLNTTWISRPIPPYIPTEEELFGEMIND